MIYRVKSLRKTAFIAGEQLPSGVTATLDESKSRRDNLMADLLSVNTGSQESG